MKLALAIGYSGASLRLPVERIRRAEELGYDSIWTAESYGSDAVSPLAYIAAITKRIRLGTGGGVEVQLGFQGARRLLVQLAVQVGHEVGPVFFAQGSHGYGSRPQTKGSDPFA